MNLNERAAKCMGWEKQRRGDYVVWADPKSTDAVQSIRGFSAENKFAGTNWPHWNPGGIDGKPGDYNHARMLYAKVVEKGLEDDVRRSVRMKKNGLNYADGFRDALDLTAEQLTLACCEVLEANNEKL